MDRMGHKHYCNKSAVVSDEGDNDEDALDAQRLSEDLIHANANNDDRHCNDTVTLSCDVG